jgi:hypothetical protein
MADGKVGGLYILQLCKPALGIIYTVHAANDNFITRFPLQIYLNILLVGRLILWSNV